jgi:hypothetical protein
MQENGLLTKFSIPGVDVLLEDLQSRRKTPLPYIECLILGRHTVLPFKFSMAISKCHQGMIVSLN